MKMANFHIDEEEDYKQFKSINAKEGLKGKDVWNKLLKIYLRNPKIIK